MVRELYLREYFQPLAQRYLTAVPEARSLMLCLAQYWCDEADDAVHELLVPSPQEQPPPWPACLEQNPLVTLDGDCLDVQDAGRLEELAAGLPLLDDNGSRIFAFASCTHEAGNQDLSEQENYRPYALARLRPSGDVEVEVIGGILRPEWEDRIDCLLESPARAGSPGSAGEFAPARPGLLARLLERLLR